MRTKHLRPIDIETFVVIGGFMSKIFVWLCKCISKCFLKLKIKAESNYSLLVKSEDYRRSLVQIPNLVKAWKIFRQFRPEMGKCGSSICEISVPHRCTRVEKDSSQFLPKSIGGSRLSGKIAGGGGVGLFWVLLHFY